MKRLRKEDAKKFAKMVLKKHGHFRSLKEFQETFLREVRKKYPEVSISSQRLKEILKEIENAKLRVHVKSAEVEEQSICPVCGKELKKVYVKTLTGKEEFIGVKCEHCGFFARNKKFKPARYEIYSIKK